MGLQSIEQDHITLSDFINTLNKTNKNKIDLDYLLKLFVDEKLNFYLKIKGNRNEIYISDRPYHCLTHIETSGNSGNNFYVTSRTAKSYSKGEKINLENNSFHLELNYFSCNLIADEAYKFNSRENIIISDNFSFEGLFKIKISPGFLSERSLDKESYCNNIRKSIYLSKTGLARLICETIEINEELLFDSDISIDPDYDKIFINYLNEIYLSKVEIDILNKDFGLFTDVNTNKPDEKLNSGSNDEMYRSIINALVFMHHPKFQKVNRKDFFITDKNRPSFNAISEAISDILEEMESKMGYSGKVRKAKTIAPFLEKFLERSPY